MGPDFSYPPADVNYRPVSVNSFTVVDAVCMSLVQMSDAADVNAIEQTMSELLFHVESNIARESPPL